MIARGRLPAPKKDNTMPMGLHQVMVADVYLAKDSKGMIIVKENEIGKKVPQAIDVDFINDRKLKYTYRFMLHPDYKWQLDKFCDAISVSNKDNSVRKEMVVGKRLWIQIQGVFYRNIETAEVTAVMDTRMIPKFRPVVLGGLRPALEGDPATGDAGGDFVKYIEVSDEKFNLVQHGRKITA